MRTLKRWATALAVVGVLGLALPASALVTEPGPCLGYDLGVVPFNDVDPNSPHRADIECISGWQITVNVGTFNPKDPVSRWQMALFITRALDLIQTPPTGASQGFTDIVGLPADQQTAINQLSQLNVTTGTTPTTYDPNGAVTRWQMALFLIRSLNAAAVALPPATDQGFTDIADLTAEAQAAINQLKALGISTGTTATTFSPNLVVTREQMASFLARTLTVMWYLDPYFESDTFTCDASQTNCSGTGSYWMNAPFTLRPGWFNDVPFASPVEQQQFFAANTIVEIRVDGAAVPTTERQVTLNGIAYRNWVAEYPTGLSGTHTIQLIYKWEGEVVSTDTFTMDFSLT